MSAATRLLRSLPDVRLIALAAGLRRDLWRHDPVGWIAEVLGGFCWSKQREIAASVVANRYTAVRSCHGSGKSWMLAHLALWWISSHPVGDALVVMTAPTTAQVKTILWREMKKAHAKGKLQGSLAALEWTIDKQIVAVGRTPKSYDPAAFQGIHERYVLVILDEACGIPDATWRQAETLITNEDSRLVAIGNPDDPTGLFARNCKPNSGYEVIKISAFDTPNFTDEEVPDELRSRLVGPSWVEERVKRYGEGSPFYRAKVLGEFPDGKDDSLIPLSFIERARERELEPGSRVRLGVDPARYGDSESVIYVSYGGHIRLVSARSGEDTQQTCGRVIQALRETGATGATIDEIGVGGGVVDSLARDGYAVWGFNAGGRSFDPEAFLNLRAEGYWMLREAFLEGKIDIDPEDDVLAEQLASLRYSTTPRGQTKIESKEDMRRRGVASPDRADALLLSTLLPPEEPEEFLVYLNGDTGEFQLEPWRYEISRY